MKARIISVIAVLVFLCMLANFAMSSPGPRRSGLTSAAAMRRYQFRKSQLLADARTLAEAVRYMLEPEHPIPNYQMVASSYPATNQPSQRVYLPRTNRVAVSFSVSLAKVRWIRLSPTAIVPAAGPRSRNSGALLPR